MLENQKIIGSQTFSSFVLRCEILASSFQGLWKTSDPDEFRGVFSLLNVLFKARPMT